ncbi:hypothetical protein WDW86_04035 [Bdellovibrionota bacterium FG-2]
MTITDVRLRYLIIGAAGGISASAVVGLGFYLYFKNAPQPDLTAQSPSHATVTIPLKAKNDRKPSSTFEYPLMCSDPYRAICLRTTLHNDPTGAVHSDVEGEVQALRIVEEIIHEHPEWTSEQVDEELTQIIYTPKRVGRIRTAFRFVRAAIEKLIRAQPSSVFSKKEKRLLISRINSVRLELPPPAAVYSDQPDLFTKNDVFYQRSQDGSLKLRVGGAFVMSIKSWFNLVFTLAHELGHSIDPCELRELNSVPASYKNLSACFLKQGLVGHQKSRTECGENDQLSETFADWLAVQITAVALKEYATEFHKPLIQAAAMNSVRDLCEQEDTLNELALEFHPSPKVRIEKIFGNNPEIRTILSCPAFENSPQYCNFMESKK